MSEKPKELPSHITIQVHSYGRQAYCTGCGWHTWPSWDQEWTDKDGAPTC